MPRAGYPLDLAAASAALPSVERSLPLVLLRARELVLRRFRPVFHARDITEQQWRVLRVVVEQGACSMQALAEACCIHPPSLSRMIPKLLARGLLHRRSDARDQRRAEISITPAGQVFHDAIAPELAQVYAQLDAALGIERSRHLLDTIAEVAGTLGGGAAFLPGPGETEDGDSGDTAA